MGSVKLGVNVPPIGEMGGGCISGADLEESAGLFALSCLTVLGMDDICGIGGGLVINGRFSETLARSRGRKREPPPRNCEMRVRSCWR